MERLCDVKGSLDRLIVTCRCIWRTSWCCSYNHVINVVPGSSSQPLHVCRVKCNIVHVKRRPGRISGSISLGIPGFMCCLNFLKVIIFIYLISLTRTVLKVSVKVVWVTFSLTIKICRNPWGQMCQQILVDSFVTHPAHIMWVVFSLGWVKFFILFVCFLEAQLKLMTSRQCNGQFVLVEQH